MQCTSCTHDNLEGARFCNNCGQPMVARCESCGVDNPPGARFCNQCAAPLARPFPPEVRATTPRQPAEETRREAESRPSRVGSFRPYRPHLAEKILSSRSALEGERKQVTVLFADVKGSMELAEQMDPEQWSQIMQRFFAILSEGVERVEGFVDKFTGDGIMALFGAPIAHEDHAQRACWTALSLRDEVRRYADELRRTHGLSFSVRMGINSGEVVVGKIGDDLRMDYTAQGHVVGLAQRMEQLAEPGTACLTEHTRRLVEGYFELRGLGAFPIKGVSNPIEVSVLEGVGRLRTRLDVSRARGFSSFVGRAREMEALQSALSSALEGKGQTVGVVGEAGVGKSRLCLEFVEACRARGIPVWQAHCPAHGRAIPMLPVLELTRDYFGIDDHDAPAEARRKVAGTLALLDDSFHADLPLAFDFLQIPDPERPLPPMDPEERQHRLLAFIRHLFEARSAQQAAVLYMDDLHWIDAESDAFLAQIVEAVGTTRTMLLVNFRPEYQAVWMNRLDYRRIPVLPLGDEAIEEMLHNLLGTDPSVAELNARIHDRGKGNPFFTEELVLALAESGALAGQPGAYRLVRADADAAIPPTVQGVLAARIDRLGERDKRVLQAAAVVGHEFDAPVLRRVARLSDGELAASLDLLRQAELVYETAIYPVAEYVFKHPLTQEVAYTSQLHESRSKTHAAVAAALIETAGDRLDERAALIAHHWEAAGKAVEAATWHARAGRWSFLRDAAVSIYHWRRVRELLSSIESPEILALRAEACREILFTIWRTGAEVQEWREVYEEGADLARRTNDKRTLAMLLSGVAGVRGFNGEHRAQIELLEEALRLATDADDFVLEASFQQRIGWAWSLAGDNHRALEWTERGLALCGRDPAHAGGVAGFDTLAWLHAQRGWCLVYAARSADAEQDFERADALAARVDDEFTRSYARSGRFLTAWLLLDRPGMVRWGLPTERDRLRSFPYAFVNRALERIEEADWSGALEACETAIAGFQSIGATRVLAYYFEACALLALTLVSLGDVSRARAVLEEIRRGVEARPELRSTPALAAPLVRAVLAVDGGAARTEIAQLTEELLRAAREGGFTTEEPFVLQYRGELAALTGDQAASRRDLRAAAESFRNLGCQARAQQIEQRLAAS